MQTKYRNIIDLSHQQQMVMHIINAWVHNNKIPIPQKEIVEQMKEQGVGLDSVKFALEALLTKGYIRCSVFPKHNTTEYVMLRGV